METTTKMGVAEKRWVWQKRTASKPVKLQRPDKGRRVQSLPMGTCSATSNCHTVMDRTRFENPQLCVDGVSWATWAQRKASNPVDVPEITGRVAFWFWEFRLLALPGPSPMKRCFGSRDSIVSGSAPRRRYSSDVSSSTWLPANTASATTSLEHF